MKINRTNYDLLLFGSDKGYEGTFNAYYLDKLFNREIQLETNSAKINEDERKLTSKELSMVNQLSKIMIKGLEAKGFELEKFILTYSPSFGEIEIQYKVENTMNTLSLSLLEDHPITKKALALARTLSKRMLKELK